MDERMGGRVGGAIEPVCQKSGYHVARRHVVDALSRAQSRPFRLTLGAGEKHSRQDF